MPNLLLPVRPGVWTIVSTAPMWDVLVDGLPWIGETAPVEPTCYCRRCYLHDDPAGCVA